MKKGYKLNEAFVERKWDKGTVQFKSSSFTDPHIIKVIDVVAKHTNKTPQFIIDMITGDITKLDKMAAKAPILYTTIIQNKVESTLFKMIEEISNGKSIEGAPQFDKTIFWDLVRYIKAEHDQFLPLRSFINTKRLYKPVLKVLDQETIAAEIDKAEKSGKGNADGNLTNKIGEFYQIGTAAASPTGEFYFNADFMQALMNYAHLVELKPKGKKYVHAGGDFPDEYGWIEFLIMHEFMHYTYDDFHYQNIIPDANPQVINWVGDFRTNYLLVKSGYSQLPMGLFNDDINFDRQVDYADMYNLVAQEMQKLAPDEQKLMAEELDDQTDDHTPGQEEGAQEPEDDEEDGPEPPPPPPGGEKEEQGPYYVEDRFGNLTINGRGDPFKNRVPNQTIAGNIRIGQKDRFNEVEYQPGKEALIIEKQDYRIDGDGNIIVRVKKGVQV